MDIFTPSPKADTGRNILWQYENATAIRGLIERKQEWLDANFKDFFELWERYFFNALNIGKDEAGTLANAQQGDEDYEASQVWKCGLSAWGKIFNLPRTYIYNGTETEVPTMIYFTLLKGELMKQGMGCSATDINRWLALVFGEYGHAYIVDNLNMTAYIMIDFDISPQTIAILEALDVIPRPAGVGVSLLNVNYNMRLYAEEFDGQYSDRDTLSGDYDEDGQTVQGNPGGLLSPYSEI